MRSRQTQDFLRSPEERTKGIFMLCPCPGKHLAELETVPQSQGCSIQGLDLLSGLCYQYMGSFTEVSCILCQHCLT